MAVSATSAHSEPDSRESRGPGRPRVQGLRARRRAQIVTAAIEVMGRFGYENASMAQIARVAGIGPATIYRYVGSKRELLDDVFDSVLHDVLDALAPQQLAAEFADAAGVIGQIRVVGDRLYTLLDSDPALIKLMGVQASAVDKDLQARVLHINEMLTAQTAQALGRLAGGPLAEASADERAMVARMLIGQGIPGVITILRSPGRSDDRRRYVRAIESVAARGILARELSTQPMLPSRTSCAAVARRFRRTGASQVRETSRRTELLDAALDCFVTLGYRDSGASTIAARAGVAHGTFYNYFANRRAVVDALVSREMANLTGLMEIYRPRPRSAAEFAVGIYILVCRVIDYAGANRAGLRFVILDAPGVDDSALGVLLAQWEQIVWLCSAYVRSGIDDGYLRDDLDAQFSGAAVMAVLYASITAVLLDESGEIDVDALAYTAMSFLCRGIG